MQSHPSPCTSDPKPQSLHAKPQSLHLNPKPEAYTLHAVSPYTLNPKPHTPTPKACTLNPKPKAYTLHPNRKSRISTPTSGVFLGGMKSGDAVSPSTLHPTPQTPNPKAYTPGPTSHTLHPARPHTLNPNPDVRSVPRGYEERGCSLTLHPTPETPTPNPQSLHPIPQTQSLHPAPQPHILNLDTDVRSVPARYEERGCRLTLHPAPCTLHSAPCTLHPES